MANNLLDKPGQKRFKCYKRQKKLVKCLIKQAKLRLFCLRTKYKYDYEVPCNYKHTLELDKKNGNTKWFNTNVLEHKKLNEYEVFIEKGKYTILKIPCGYHKVRIHTVFDIKHNGQHRARVVVN